MKSCNVCSLARFNLTHDIAMLLLLLTSHTVSKNFLRKKVEKKVV